MDGGTIREQQTLVWAERHAGTRLNQAGPALSHLDALLGGSPRERGQASNSEERVADSEGEYDAEKAPAL